MKTFDVRVFVLLRDHAVLRVPGESREEAESYIRKALDSMGEVIVYGGLGQCPQQLDPSIDVLDYGVDTEGSLPAAYEKIQAAPTHIVTFKEDGDWDLVCPPPSPPPGSALSGKALRAFALSKLTAAEKEVLGLRTPPAEAYKYD